MSHISDSNYQEGTAVSLSPTTCLSIYTLFLPNKHFTSFTVFHLYAEIHFYTAGGPGPCQ